MAGRTQVVSGRGGLDSSRLSSRHYAERQVFGLKKTTRIRDPGLPCQQSSTPLPTIYAGHSSWAQRFMCCDSYQMKHWNSSAVPSALVDSGYQTQVPAKKKTQVPAGTLGSCRSMKKGRTVEPILASGRRPKRVIPSLEPRPRSTTL